jgi:hypothetical protein
MNPELPSSHHPTNIEEEDSPLQQLAFPPTQPMADSYPKDITYEAEEDIEDPPAEEMAEEEDNGGRGKMTGGEEFRPVARRKIQSS